VLAWATSQSLVKMRAGASTGQLIRTYLVFVLLLTDEAR
jgi:hypothetical protein